MQLDYIDGETTEVEPTPAGKIEYVYDRGVFETIRTIRGLLFNWKAHRDRLKESAAGIGLELSDRKLTDIYLEAQGLVSANREKWSDPKQEARVRIQVSDEGKVYIQALPLKEVSAQMRRKGVRVGVAKRTRKNPLVKGIDPDYVEWAQAEKAEQDVQEILLINEVGHVTEGSMSNLFIVNEGVLITPEDDILKGTTRARVLNVAESLGLSVEFKNLTLEDIEAAGEVFICSVSRDSVPVVKVGDHEIGTGNPGLVTARITKALIDSRNAQE
jgi:branched-subunit amino acid aminotransferase/4-amino-4-deoxychorismate lyase